MAKFKVGDKVKRIKGLHIGMIPGDIGTITRINSCGGLELEEYIASSNDKGIHHENNFELLSTTNTTTIMSLNAKIKESKMKEPIKSFVKLNVTDDQGKLTSEGREAFVDWLFANPQNQADFKKEIVDPIIKAEENNK